MRRLTALLRRLRDAHRASMRARHVADLEMILAELHAERADIDSDIDLTERRLIAARLEAARFEPFFDVDRDLPTPAPRSF